MTDELLQRLETLPQSEPRSRLEPYRELILRWRRQGRSYRKIQRILAKECKLDLSQQAVRKFVKVRSRPQKAQLELEATAVKTTSPDQSEFTLKRTEGGSDPYADVRARMARDKAQPVQPKPAKVFEYTDEDSMKPIVLLKPTKEK